MLPAWQKEAGMSRDLIVVLVALALVLIGRYVLRRLGVPT